MWVSVMADRNSERLNKEKKTGKGMKNLKTYKDKSKGCVVIPYVEGLSENIDRVMNKRAMMAL